MGMLESWLGGTCAILLPWEKVAGEAGRMRENHQTLAFLPHQSSLTR
jgi:hypothetical protein